MSFTDRADLTREENQALRYYQDIGNPQHNWEIEIPKDEPHKDCYVINNALRFAEFRSSLSNHDQQLVDSLIAQLDSAIAKSVTTRQAPLAKGLDNAGWIRSKLVGETYIDRGFGSYSTSKERAKEYAKIQPDGARVFIYRYVNSGKHAVYMGKSEQKLLLPRERKYIVVDIQHELRGTLFD